MSEKELLIANMNASEEIFEKLSVAETEFVNSYNKYAKEIKGQGDSSGGRIIVAVFSFFFCTFVVGFGAVFFVASFLEKIWEPLSYLAVPFFLFGPLLWVYMVFIKPAQKKKLLKTKDSELEALKQSPQLAWLPYDYRNTSDIEIIKEAVQYNRVDSLRDALKLCDQKNMQDSLNQYNYG